jgi:Cu/Ag efflux pump CusA
LNQTGHSAFHPISVVAESKMESQKRIAVPMLGGMVSSLLLTLIVIPAVYAIVKGWGLKEGAPSEADTRLRISVEPQPVG